MLVAMTPVRFVLRPHQSRYVRPLAILAGIAGVYILYFWHLGSYPLLPPNEGLYAEIAREMNQTGDYLTPHLNHLRYYEKPPLFYWCTAAAFRLFGETEFAARLTSATAGIATILVTFFIGTRLSGRRLGLYAALVAGSAVGMIGMFRLTMLDPLLTLWVAIAFLGFVTATSPPRQRWGSVLCAAGLGLGVMTKGPVALAICLPPMLAYLALTGEWRRWRELMLWQSALVFLAIAAPWHVALSLHDPSFAWFYFVNETINRFLGTRIPADFRTDTPDYYLIRTLGLFAPWSLLLPAAMMAYPRRKSLGRQADPDPLPGDRDAQIDGGTPLDVEPPARDRTYLLAMLWFVWPLVFFSLSTSKANYYLLPTFPAQALLVARLWCLMDYGRVRSYLPRRFIGVSFVLMIAGVVYGMVMAETSPPLIIAQLDSAARVQVDWALRASAALWIAGCVAGLGVKPRSRAAWLMALGMVALVLAVGNCLERRGDELAGRQAAQVAAEYARDGVPVLLDGRYEIRSTVNFYLNRRIACISDDGGDGSWGDLWFGNRLEPSPEWFPTHRNVLARIRRGERMVLLVGFQPQVDSWLRHGQGLIANRGCYADTWVLTANL